MYVCVALANTFYALWTIEMPYPGIRWTIPALTIILMRYSLDVEGETDGDPVEVIIHDGILIGMVAAYGICMFCMLYIFRS